MERRQPPGDLLVEDDQVTSRPGGAAVGLIALALTLAGCSAGTGTIKVKEPSRSATTSKASAAPTRAPAPQAGACYDLTVNNALQLSSSAAPTPCSGPHTSVTVAIGRFDPHADGTPVVVDSERLQRQIARTCTRKVDAHVGGSVETLRLSRIQAVWFSPTQAQVDAGAAWFRCDLVIAGTSTTFAPLPARTRGLLGSSAALDRYGTCGTASPAAPAFRRVACSTKHSWRARASIALPRTTRYLGKAAGKKADATCRDIEARRAPTSSTLRWSFEWPTPTQWKNGQRYGLCWTPA